MKAGWRVLFGFALGAIALGMSSPAQDQISKLTDAEILRGKLLFVGHCAVCHGIEATGGRGPALNQPKLRRAADDRALFQIIKNGIDGTEMPDAWQMNEHEIWDVAGYVRSLSRAQAAKLAGDPAKGKKLYESKACASCHIIQGIGGSLGPELTYVGASRSAAYLREALLDPGASAPEGFVVVTVVARDGRSVRGIRVNEDSFTIQLRDAANQFHSFRKLDLGEFKKEFGASLMPSYRGVLNDSEIEDLVAYLAGLRGER
jgi:putative heme-binding domain-containing protein